MTLPGDSFIETGGTDKMKRGICILAAAIALCAGNPAHTAQTGIAAPCALNVPYEVRKFSSFAHPDALLDPDVLWRISPTDNAALR